MLYYLTTVLYVLVCLVLMLVILLQQGKGGDIASAFGGGGSQTAFGARSGATVLSRATAIGAVLFIVGALVLGILGQRGPGSVVGGRSQTGVPATAPAPAQPAAPATPAPAPAK
jgi:preprotein translocase subunit SecG